MYLHLLEIVYAIEGREAVEMWLSQANLSSVVISTEQYDNEILAVLASKHAVEEAHQEMQWHPAISSCEGKKRVVYRITTTSTSEHALDSFPFCHGEEYYVGPKKTMYLSVLSHQLSEKQLSWLIENSDVVEWEYLFDLTSVLAVGDFGSLPAKCDLYVLSPGTS